MSKKIRLTVEVTLSDEVTKSSQIIAVTENVLKALVNHIDGSEEGIVGDDFEGYTTKLVVSSLPVTKVWNLTPCQIGTV